jgi:nucleoside-diphosphate-sugar epimerase
MKTVLITGGAGFLGSHLSSVLLEKGFKVICVDDLSHGDIKNISDSLSSPHFTFHQRDVLDKDFLMGISNGVDLLVHFATYKIPREGGSLKTVEVNTKGTEIILEAAKERKISVILGSTDDVYGKNPELPFSEESALVVGSSNSIRWSDAISKMYAEQLCFAYRAAYRIPVNILRFSIIYGPRQRKDWWGGPQGVFIQSALKREPIPIHGDGLQVRNFVYVSDAVEGILRLVEREEVQGEVFNIGSPDRIRILDLAFQIWSLVGNSGRPQIEFIAYSDLCQDYEDVRVRDVDLAKARYLLNYEAKTGIEEGLKRTIDWFRRNG